MPLTAIALLARPAPFLQWCRTRYGDRFTLRLGRFGTVVYLVDPEDIRAVFRGEPTVFHAGESNAPLLAQILGDSSVLVTDDEVHRRQRKLLSPPFHGPAVLRQQQLMASVAAEEIRSWPVGTPFAAMPAMARITLEVILRTVIGVDDPARLATLRSALPPLVALDSFTMLQFAFPALKRRWPWSRFRTVEARADALLREEIDRTRRDPALATRSDVLAMLIRASDGEDATADPAMSDDELRDQLVTLLLAGHETTATGLSWALERLTRTPAVLAGAVAAADSGDDAYLDAVIAETLRSRPVVTDVGRRLTAPVAVGDMTLPAGVTVNAAIALVHHDGVLYPDPDRFDPSRFEGARPDPAVWLPFGGGNRRCLGATFAQVEMRTVLGEILRRVELAPTTAPGERQRTRHVTLVPARGARIVIATRPQGPSAGSPSPLG